MNISNDDVIAALSSGQTSKIGGKSQLTKISGSHHDNENGRDRILTTTFQLVIINVGCNCLTIS